MVVFQTVAKMRHGEGAWNGGDESGLRGDEGFADAVGEGRRIRGVGVGGGMECVHHADDGSKQAEQRGGGHERRHETDFMADQLRVATMLQRRQRDEIAVPYHEGDDDDGNHQIAASL